MNNRTVHEVDASQRATDLCADFNALDGRKLTEKIQARIDGSL
ncbi:hypothetical protein BCO37747_08053 [Burkholderia contaminans]|nr:hypothetical protein BCO37747_08053 [Burkholderia contaminans]